MIVMLMLLPETRGRTLASLETEPTEASLSPLAGRGPG